MRFLVNTGSHQTVISWIGVSEDILLTETNKTWLKKNEIVNITREEVISEKEYWGVNQNIEQE